MSKTINLGAVPAGPQHPPVIVAEMSGNHDGSLDRALEIVRAVAASGAQMLKLQTYTAEDATIHADTQPFRISDGPHELPGVVELRTTLYPVGLHTLGVARADLRFGSEKLGLVSFSSPLTRQSAIDLLEKLDAPVYKVASSNWSTCR